VGKVVSVIFEGSIGKQLAAGELVTLTITNPDGTSEKVTTKTLDDATFSVEKDFTQGGKYSVTAHVDADGKYNEWNSAPQEFVVLEDRSGTLTVKVNES
jgi:hypothetical protein